MRIAHTSGSSIIYYEGHYLMALFIAAVSDNYKVTITPLNTQIILFYDCYY